jgi:hypothetical protein
LAAVTASKMDSCVRNTVTRTLPNKAVHVRICGGGDRRLSFLLQQTTGAGTESLFFKDYSMKATFGKIILAVLFVFSGHAIANTTTAIYDESRYWFRTSSGSHTIGVGVPALEDVKTNIAFIASTPHYSGYWLVTPGGEIAGAGAPHLCGQTGEVHTLKNGTLSGAGDLRKCSNYKGKNTIVSAAATSDREGLWVLGNDGSVYTAGNNARALGDASKVRGYEQAVEILPTPDDMGYVIVGGKGGVFTFGNATFFGSTGGKLPLGVGVTDAALSIGSDGKMNGYWLLLSSGAIMSFGQAKDFGNLGSRFTSMAALPNGRGYVLTTPYQSDSQICSEFLKCHGLGGSPMPTKDTYKAPW